MLLVLLSNAKWYKMSKANHSTISEFSSIFCLHFCFFQMQKIHTWILSRVLFILRVGCYLVKESGQCRSAGMRIVTGQASHRLQEAVRSSCDAQESGKAHPPRQWLSPACSAGRRPLSSPAVQLKTADSCSWYQPNDQEHSLIFFFLQAHFLGNQADNMLMWIGRLELKRQKEKNTGLPLGRNKGQKISRWPCSCGFPLLFRCTQQGINKRWGMQERPVVTIRILNHSEQ